MLVYVCGIRKLQNQWIAIWLSVKLNLCAYRKISHSNKRGDYIAVYMYTHEQQMLLAKVVREITPAPLPQFYGMMIRVVHMNMMHECTTAHWTSQGLLIIIKYQITCDSLCLHSNKNKEKYKQLKSLVWIWLHLRSQFQISTGTNLSLKTNSLQFLSISPYTGLFCLFDILLILYWYLV